MASERVGSEQIVGLDGVADVLDAVARFARDLSSGKLQLSKDPEVRRVVIASHTQLLDASRHALEKFASALP